MTKVNEDMDITQGVFEHQLTLSLLFLQLLNSKLIIFIDLLIKKSEKE